MPNEEFSAEEIKALLRQAGGARASKRRRGPTPGTQLTNSCLSLLKMRGAFAFRVNVVGVWDERRQVYRTQKTKGASDILGYLPGGRGLAVEVKASGDKVTPDQQLFLDSVREKGGLAVVARSLDDLVQALDREGY